MKKRLLCFALGLGLALFSACSSQPADVSPTAAPADGVASVLIDAAAQLIQAEEYAAAGAVLDRLDERALSADATQALGLLRSTLKARLPQNAQAQVAAAVTAPPLATLSPSLSPQADPDLLATRQQEVNIFLTALAETDLAALPEEDAVDFALRYLCRHQPDALTHQDGCCWVSAEQVEYTVARFFGLEARHSSGQGYTYREGRYEISRSTADDGSFLAVASDAVSLGGGQYAVTFDRYTGEPGEDLSAFHGFTSREIAVSRLSYADSGEAILQAVVWEGRETFQLLEWRLAQ